MDRGNKHGHRLDDQLAHEVNGIKSRTDEAFDPEPAGEDQPDATYEGQGTPAFGAPPGMTPEEVRERSDLGRYVPRHVLPGKRGALLAGAHEQNAPDAVLDKLRTLPADHTYHTVAEIWAALGGHNEDVTRRT
jgi:hypothetical protein